jgi:hypothetical protein
MMHWSVVRPLGRRYAIIWGAPDIPFNSALKSVLDLLAVVFVIGLRKHLIVSRYVMQGAKLSVN